jgi:hypothetical protein
MKNDWQNNKKYRKQRWQRKTTAEKFATIWLYAIFGTILAGLTGLLATAMVIACWTMPWTFTLYVAIGAIVVCVTFWAFSQAGID